MPTDRVEMLARALQRHSDLVGTWAKREAEAVIAALDSLAAPLGEAATDASLRGPVNYLAGANIAGFLKVADAMLDQGVV